MTAAYLKGPAPPEPKCTKNRYLSYAQARNAALGRMRDPNPNTLALWVYPCRECGWFHMTSTPQEGQEPITGA